MEGGLRERSGALARELQETQVQRDALDAQLQVGLGGKLGVPGGVLMWSPRGLGSLGGALGSPLCPSPCPRGAFGGSWEVLGLPKMLLTLLRGDFGCFSGKIKGPRGAMVSYLGSFGGPRVDLGPERCPDPSPGASWRVPWGNGRYQMCPDPHPWEVLGVS